MTIDRIYSKQVIETNEAVRRRVEKLNEFDRPKEDSMLDLAIAEDEIRKDMAEDGIAPELIEKYANRFGIAMLERAEAKRDSWVDDLTGLHNDEALRGEVPTLLSLEKRTGEDCSLLMIDLDEFKSINDQHGHQAGNQALQVVASIIRSSIRKSDFLYRYGGDEFTVVLMNTSSDMARSIAEKIQDKMRTNIIIVEDTRGRRQKVQRTVSIGCIGTDQLELWKEVDDDDVMPRILETMIRRADGALLAAKKKGKQEGDAGDRIAMYESEAAST
ncbi:GGDEF domain-containing protein [Patescibacteria group bacterium]|nr:MAG: GGDEF domain-containing protein [Patescibacteria group bacterium]